MAAVAEAGCKPAPRLDGRHARRGLAWTRVHRFADGDPSRYASLLRVPTGWASFEGEHWLVVKNGSWPAANGAASLVVFRGCDARLRTRGGEDSSAMATSSRAAPGSSQLCAAFREVRLGRDGRDVGEAPRDVDAACPHARGPEVAPARARPDSLDGPPRLRREAPRPRRAVPLRRALLARVGETIAPGSMRGATRIEGGGRAVFVAKDIRGWGRLKPSNF